MSAGGDEETRVSTGRSPKAERDTRQPEPVSALRPSTALSLSTPLPLPPISFAPSLAAGQNCDGFDDSRLAHHGYLKAHRVLRAPPALCNRYSARVHLLPGPFLRDNRPVYLCSPTGFARIDPYIRVGSLHLRAREGQRAKPGCHHRPRRRQPCPT